MIHMCTGLSDTFHLLDHGHNYLLDCKVDKGLWHIVHLGVPAKKHFNFSLGGRKRFDIDKGLGHIHRHILAFVQILGNCKVFEPGAIVKFN